jgi:uncharacterized membrane protein
MRKYSGYAYVKKLERCLRKMPYEERLDAVNYYSEYLADAGPDHEQEVIARLGPPQRVAAEIKADAALRELNAKAEIAEKVKARKKAKKEGRYARTNYAYGSGGGTGGPDYAQGEPYGEPGYAQSEPSSGSDYGQGEPYDGEGYGQREPYGDESYAQREPYGGAGYDPGYGADESEGERDESPKMGESFSAAGLGALGMLAMPVARPLAILACVLGIIGLVFSVIAVAGIFIAAGALAAGGVFITVVSFVLISQDVTVTIFLGGAGVAFIGVGLLIGALNYLLGRAIFKGIANLSGRIRHKRVKVRRETFNYVYQQK